MSDENWKVTIHDGVGNLRPLELSQPDFGVLSRNFLEMEVGSLAPSEPRCILGNESVARAVSLLKAERVGCLLVVDEAGMLIGIFSERDCVFKAFGVIEDLSKVKVADLMTPDPVTGSYEMSVAYALNLMSQGGFRHLPLVDVTGRPQGVLSVKNIVDAISARFIAACNI